MTRAVVIHTTDGSGTIVVGERDVREPGIGEVLIRFHAAAVNPAEVVMWLSSTVPSC
jgi:NADPH:quinone reductase-like Zn-dependent oxidoreductase